MQIFLVGKTKTGKSTLASTIQKGFPDAVIYEAGSWVRSEFAQLHGSFNEFDPVFKEQLTAYALAKLSNDHYYSLKQYESFLKNNRADIVIIAGVRNPDDFIGMLRYGNVNKVIMIEDGATMPDNLETFETGIDVMAQYLAWKQQNGVGIDTIYTNVEEIDSNCVAHKLNTFFE